VKRRSPERDALNLQSPAPSLIDSPPPNSAGLQHSVAISAVIGYFMRSVHPGAGAHLALTVALKRRKIH